MSKPELNRVCLANNNALKRSDDFVSDKIQFLRLLSARGAMPPELSSSITTARSIHFSMRLSSQYGGERWLQEHAIIFLGHGDCNC